MTDRAEIERLLNQTGRTLEGVTKVEIGYGSRRNGKTASIIKHQSDVIELLVGALRDALDVQKTEISDAKFEEFIKKAREAAKRRHT